MNTVSQTFGETKHHWYFGTLTWYLLVILLFLLSLRFTHYLLYTLAALAYPFELAYGEGIVLWQYQALLNGDFLRSPLSLYPYIVYHYPPVYYIATYIASTLITDPLWAGRAISIFSAFGIGILVFTLILLSTSTQPKGARIVGACCGALLVFSSYPVFIWSKLMRVDMLSVLLSLMGILCVHLSLQSRKYLYLSVVFFIAAFFTKQTSIAGAMAGLGLSLIVWPRVAIRAIALYIVMGLAILVYMYFATDGEALRHLFTYNMNPFNLRHGLGLFHTIAKNHLLILYVVIGFVLFSVRLALVEIYRKKPWRQLLCEGELFSITLYTLYFLSSSATLITVFKVGSNGNYFTEWMVICSLICGILVTRAIPSPNIIAQLPEKYCRNPFFFQSKWLLMLLILQTAATMVMSVPQVMSGKLTVPGLTSKRARDAARVLDLIKSTPGKVLSEDMTLLVKAGKEIPWEPAIITQLTHTGVFDQTKVIKMIAERDFGLIVLTLQRRNRFTLEVSEAIHRFYHRLYTIGKYTVYAPS